MAQTLLPVGRTCWGARAGGNWKQLEAAGGGWRRLKVWVTGRPEATAEAGCGKRNHKTSHDTTQPQVRPNCLLVYELFHPNLNWLTFWRERNNWQAMSFFSTVTLCLYFFKFFKGTNGCGVLWWFALCCTHDCAVHMVVLCTWLCCHRRRFCFFLFLQLAILLTSVLCRLAKEFCVTTWQRKRPPAMPVAPTKAAGRGKKSCAVH